MLPVPAVPKVMTPVSCLNEICVVRKLSIPKYESKAEIGVAHMKIFTMEVHVRDMELRGMLHPGRYPSPQIFYYNNKNFTVLKS